MIIVFDNIKRQFYSKENPTCIRIFQRLWEGEKKIWMRERKPMKNELKRKKNQYFDKFYQIIQKMNAENDKRKKNAVN